MAGINITHERMCELLDYNQDTGVFTWKVRPSKWSKVRAGDRAGGVRNGYRFIGIEGGQELEHRIAWFYVMGEWPIGKIDHRNGCPGDNRFANLRPATTSQNAQNKRKNRGCSSELKGVSFCKQTGKWRSAIQVSGRTKHLGRFDCEAAAHLAYVVAANDAFGEFSRAA